MTPPSTPSPRSGDAHSVALDHLLASPPDLPVVAGLARLAELLSTTDENTGTSVVVVAPPGTGKTTLIPPLVAQVLSQCAVEAGTAPTPTEPGRVLVTQPRRLATRAAARRLASLLGEPVGQTVGYAVRGERVVGQGCRIEFVTAGLALRRLQADPGLDGITGVVLDEVHERSLDADLLLALLLDARALRPDLALVAMSATADLSRLPALLGTADAAAPVLSIPSPIHPVAERWAPPPTGVSRLGPRGVPDDFLAHVARTVSRVLDDPTCPGDVLVFAPGVREVEEISRQVRQASDVEVLPLHGRLPAAAQDLVLAARSGPPPADGGHVSAPVRRVVVSTNVAESSLTVPGVRVVVDSTLTREPRLDPTSGMSGLVTVGESRSSGTQRAGRAGREASGVVVRCCTPADWSRSPQAPTPQIRTADLTTAALELAVWGAVGGQGLEWLEEPARGAMTSAQAALTALCLTDAKGHPTPAGRVVATLPVPVREGRALLEAARQVGTRRAAEAVALLTADVRPPGGDLVALAHRLRDSDSPEAKRWRQEASRLRQSVEHALGRDRSQPTTQLDDKDLVSNAVGLVCALTHPEWIARRRGPAPSPGRAARYVSVGGTGMEVITDSALTASTWLAVAEVSRSQARADATVRAAAPIDPDLARTIAGAWLTQEEVVTWEGSTLRASQVRRLGGIELGTTPLPAPQLEVVATAVVDRCRREGLEILDWDSPHATDGTARELRARLSLLHHTLGEPWPAMDTPSLLTLAERWLAPAAAQAGRSGSRRGFSLDDVDVFTALGQLLPWPQASRLEQLAPTRIRVPSGAAGRLRYLDDQDEWLDQPVLAVRLQDCFGWAQTPRIVDGQVGVVLHLLSPAGRPLAVTADLKSFWEGPYQQVRREMRGRYPKHAWPQDPWSTPAGSPRRSGVARPHTGGHR